METELREKIKLMQHLLHKRHRREREGYGPMADVRQGQGRILALLKMQDGINVKDLAYLLGTGVPSVSEFLTKLEKGGYVIREQSKDDKRIVIVKLTKKGKEQRQLEEPGMEDVFAVLTAEEQKTLAEYLDRINQSLKNILGLEDEDFPLHGCMEERMRHFHKREDLHFCRGGDERRGRGCRRHMPGDDKEQKM
jgi:DNA-binding MarR family transcriptional regulator